MYCRVFATTFVLLSVLGTASSKESVAKSNITTPALRNSYVIKLAVFGDSNFGERFNHDNEKILQYWQAVLYDVHLRFQTLSSLDISFHLTSLTTLKTQKEQKFIEKSRKENGTYSIPSLLENFQHFAYSNQNKLPSFDIAVLILADLKEDTHNFTGNPICHEKDNNSPKWTTVSVHSFLNNPAKYIAYNVAKILGAPNDDDPIFNNTCEANPFSEKLCCILDAKRNRNKIGELYYFSQCTNKFLVEHQHDISCLMTSSTKYYQPLIDSAKLFKSSVDVPAYSSDQQCKLLLNDAGAFTIMELDCETVFCGSISGFRWFAPLEGSHCEIRGSKGRCLRGDCIQPQVQLVNLATDKCLVSENGRFVVNDQPVLRNCSEIPMDKLVDEQIEEGPIYEIQAMYSTVNGLDNKQMTLDSDYKLRFGSIDTFNENPKASWIVDKLGKEDNEEFVLKNRAAGLCAKAAENGLNVEVTSDCSGGDNATKWKFVRSNSGDFLNEFAKQVYKRVKILVRRFRKTLNFLLSNKAD